MTSNGEPRQTDPHASHLGHQTQGGDRANQGGAGTGERIKAGVENHAAPGTHTHPHTEKNAHNRDGINPNPADKGIGRNVGDNKLHLPGTSAGHSGNGPPSIGATTSAGVGAGKGTHATRTGDNTVRTDPNTAHTSDHTARTSEYKARTGGHKAPSSANTAGTGITGPVHTGHAAPGAGIGGADAHPADPGTYQAHTGTHAAGNGTHTSDTHAAGTNAAGTHAAGIHAPDIHAPGIHAAGTGTHTAGTHTAGVHAPGTHTAGNHTTGNHTNGAGTQTADTGISGLNRLDRKDHANPGVHFNDSTAPRVHGGAPTQAQPGAGAHAPVETDANKAGPGLGAKVKAGFGVVHGTGEAIRGSINGMLDDRGDAIAGRNKGDVASRSNNADGDRGHWGVADKGIDKVSRGLDTLTGDTKRQAQ